MALNFPDNPSVNDVYRDSTSGFAYQWDGTVWQSYSDSSLGQIQVLDDISGSFNSSTQTFALTSSSTAITPANAQQIRVVLGGVVQDPASDYTVSGSNITFTTPPAGGLSFSGVVFGTAVPINTILDGTVTEGSLRISTKSVVGSATTFTEDLVVNGSARVVGVLTVGTSSLTLNGDTNQINGVTISSGIITASSFSGDGSGLTGVGIGSTGDINTSGIITASSFSGDGSGLTGVGIGSTGDINTSGIITASSFSGDGSGLTGVGIGSTGDINTSGIITATKISAQEFEGFGDKLIFSPTITSFSPTDGATGVSALSSPDISITYNQPVNLGTGVTITLRKDSASGTIVESYEVGVSTRATLSNQTLTIDPIDNFDYDQEYYVVIPQGTVTNYVDGNNALLDTYNFTTEAGPVVTSVTPGFGATDVGFSTNIVFTYDKNIRAGVGTITLRTVSAAGTITESYDVTSSGRLTFSTNTLTIDPTSDLDNNTNYYVVVPDDAVAGYAGTDTYNFTTLNFALDSINPTNGATNVGIDTNITLTFNNPPTKGTGTVELRSGSVGGSLIESFNAASSGQITVSGNDWILNPSSNLNYSTTVYTIIPSTAINNYVGLNTTGADSHSFTTKALALGDPYEGGYLICQASSVQWIVAPSSAEVSRNWYQRFNAITRAQQVSGCTGWFVPTCGQLQNPGYTCRTYWDSYSSTFYWSSTEFDSSYAWNVFFGNGNTYASLKTYSLCVRAFRCVSY